jgi:AmmeMemoRadiSam system protein B
MPAKCREENLMALSARDPAVAGLFYPDHPAALSAEVTSLLAAAPEPRREHVRALIVPHAGYVYSGATAAAAYRCLEPVAADIRRVVLLGPAHRVYLQGMAVPSVALFSTPLGDIPVDREAVARLLALPGVVEADAPHVLEHSLEVQLPFLQTVLGSFSVVPVVVGECPPDAVAAVFEALWGDTDRVVDTLFVVSSDLSHFLSYERARAADAVTSRRIQSCAADLTPEDACGARAVNGLLAFAGRRGMHVRELDLRNSGDSAGDRDRVVGYGAYAIS